MKSFICASLSPIFIAAPKWKYSCPPVPVMLARAEMVASSRLWKSRMSRAEMSVKRCSFRKLSMCAYLLINRDYKFHKTRCGQIHPPVRTSLLECHLICSTSWTRCSNSSTISSGCISHAFFWNIKTLTRGISLNISMISMPIAPSLA